MKNNKEYGNVLTYLSIVVVSVFLLFLITPNLGLWSRVNLLVVLPVLAIAGAGYYQFYRARNGDYTHSSFSKILALTATIAGVMGLIASYLGGIQPRFTEDTILHFFELTAILSVFVAYFASALLIARQKFVYWPIWNKSDKNSADERQKYVRQRVFEKSYLLNIITLALIVLVLNISLYSFDRILLFLAGLSLLSTPAILATWQKDS